MRATLLVIAGILALIVAWIYLAPGDSLPSPEELAEQALNAGSAEEQEAAAVKQAVKNIVSTNRYEKPFNMNFGSNITGMLFELAHSQMDRSIAQDIRSTLHKYEPRAKIMDINIVSNPDAYSLRVRLTFRILTTGEVIDLETTISRLR